MERERKGEDREVEGYMERERKGGVRRERTGR